MASANLSNIKIKIGDSSINASSLTTNGDGWLIFDKTTHTLWTSGLQYGGYDSSGNKINDTYSTTVQLQTVVNSLDTSAFGNSTTYIQSIIENNGIISAMTATMPTKLSQFTNDSGYWLGSSVLPGWQNGVTDLSFGSVHTGVSYYNHYSGSALGNFQAVLTAKDGNTGVQFSTNWCVDNGDTPTGYLYYRVKRDVAPDWSNYRNILDAGNYSSYALPLHGTADAAAVASRLGNFYSSRPTSADITPTGSGGVISFKATSAMTKSKPAADSHILHFYWDNTGGWDCQMAISTANSPTIQTRGQNAGTWGSWKTVLDSTNYSSYALPLSGGTLSGDINMGNNNITDLKIGGGIFWNPYVESSTDNSDSASIRVIAGGVAGGTELRIEQNNDANDVVNIVTNSINGLLHNGVIVLNASNYTSYNSFTSGLSTTTLSLSGQLVSSIATGTSPLSVSSTTLNTNLNADLLDNQHGSYYTDYADTAVNNLQIGGRNILLDSKGKFQPTYSRIDNWNEYTNSLIYMENGKQYIISGKTNGIFTDVHDISVESDNCVLWIISSYLNNFGINQIVSSNTTGTIGTTFIWRHQTGTYCLRVNGYKIDNSTYAENVKVEEGNKATAWTPAPEDVAQDAISKANAAQTSSQDNLAEKLGYSSYSDMVSQAVSGKTLIVGGYINSQLIQTNALAVGNVSGLQDLLNGKIDTSLTNAPSTILNSNVTVTSLGAATPQNITDAVNNLQIGGRNLILNSNKSSYLSSIHLYPSNLHATVSGDYAVFDLSSGDLNGEELLSDYTFTISQSGWITESLMIECDGTFSIDITFFDNTTGHHGIIPVIVALSNNTYLVYASYNNPNTYPIRCIDLNVHTTNATYLKLRHPKLEYGNKPTTWTPAPEDVDAAINSAITTAETDAATKYLPINGNAASASKVNNALSWSGYSSGSFNGSAAASISIPTKLSQFTNDSGYWLGSSVLPGMQNGVTDLSFGSVPTGVSYYNHYNGSALGNYRAVLTAKDGSTGVQFSTYWYVNNGDTPAGSIYYRVKCDNAPDWSNYQNILDAGNYSSYALPLHGTADAAAVASRLGQNGNSGIPMTFNWSGQSGQPNWLWGGSDGTNMYVYNPSNFNVAYASNSGALSGYTESSFLRYRGYLSDASNAMTGINTTGWKYDSANYKTLCGDSLHIQGFATWYNRLDFGTNGRIYFWQAINPSNLTGCMNYIGTLAYTSDNVASATKLQTQRTLWGQSFDGTGNISGNIVMNSADGTYIQIGGARIVYDKTNSALYVVGSDGTTSANFYATGGVTAYGAGSGTSGGGTSYNRLDSWSDYTSDKATYVLSALLGSNLDTRLTAVENSSLTSVSWSIITGKPSSYVPSAHTHVWSDITDHPTKLSQFTNDSEFITISSVPTKLSQFTNDSGFITGINWTNVVDKPTKLSQFTNDSGYLSSVSWDIITGKPSSYVPSAHTHVWSDITDHPTKLSQFTNNSGFITISSVPTKLSQLTDDIVNGNYLKRTGGTLSGTALFTFADSGNWSHSNSGVTFPVTRGGFLWSGQSDWVKLFAEETSSDNLNLVLQFGDDNSNGLSIRNAYGVQTAYISALGIFTGTLNGNASSASKVNNALSWSGYSSGSFNGSAAKSISIPNNTSQLTNGAGFITSSASISGNATSASKVNSALSWSGYNSGSFNGSSAASFAIPNNTNQLTNGAGFITSSASITGNAATATKLATARTLWGQSFDGTGNISGALTGVTTISASGAITTSGTFHAGGAATLGAGLTVTGNILATGGVTAYTSSDRRLKKNIRPADSLRVIRTLGGTFEFDYRKDNRHSIGFIAQNVFKSDLSDIVKESEGYYKINYLDTRLISLALGASVELDDEVTRLKKRVSELELEVKQLKSV